jgi:hypothetical protein
MMVCRDENELFENFPWNIEYENENSLLDPIMIFGTHKYSKTSYGDILDHIFFEKISF